MVLDVELTVGLQVVVEMLHLEMVDQATHHQLHLLKELMVEMVILLEAQEVVAEQLLQEFQQVVLTLEEMVVLEQQPQLMELQPHMLEVAVAALVQVLKDVVVLEVVEMEKLLLEE